MLMLPGVELHDVPAAFAVFRFPERVVVERQVFQKVRFFFRSIEPESTGIQNSGDEIGEGRFATTPGRVNVQNEGRIVGLTR